VGSPSARLQRNLARRVVSQVFATHDVADALVSVVDDHGQLIGPEAVGAPQHEVAHGLRDVLLLGPQAGGPASG